MQLTKRMIAIVLVIAMVVELVPQSILAQDSTTAITTEVSELEDGTEKEPDSTENLIPLNKNDFDTIFKVTDKWDGTFQADIVISNNTDKTIENWNVTFSFIHEITQIWNAFVFDHKGDIYQIKNAEWNSDIKPGESVSFSFQAKWDNETIQEPQNF